MLAVEDHRFYQHRGVDPLTLGATIEVQLAKWLYTGGRSGLLDQSTQAVLALKLDVEYPKSRILLMYLNTVYFGHGFYGAIAAAYGCFRCVPDELTWPQAALLAGLLKAPDGLDPTSIQLRRERAATTY